MAEKEEGKNEEIRKKILKAKREMVARVEESG